MKQCPQCFQTYSDDQLNFCLEDGALLSGFVKEPPPTRYVDDSPPTLVMNESRRTNPTNWAAAPPAQWQPNQQNLQYRPYAPMRLAKSTDQTIPTLALILGIFSLPMCWCGWLGLPAAILGYLGMRNADTNGERYGGRGMAVAGMVMGVISFLVFLLFIILTVASR